MPCAASLMRRIRERARRLPIASLLVLSLSATALYRSQQLGVAASQADRDSQVQRQSMLGAKGAAYKQLGKRLVFPQLELVGASSAHSPLITQPATRLLLVFSDLSCNVCRDRETAFAKTLAAEAAVGQVAAVVSASNRRYVASFARVSGANFPIYFDINSQFIRQNGIENQPLLMVINKDNEVVAAEYPLPGQAEWSEPFHDTSRRLLLGRRVSQRAR